MTPIEYVAVTLLMFLFLWLGLEFIAFVCGLIVIALGAAYIMVMTLWRLLWFVWREA